MSNMITARMPSDRVAAVDALVAAGAYDSRSAFILAAIEKLVAELENQAAERAIVEAYMRIPQTEADLRWADASFRQSLQSDPW